MATVDKNFRIKNGLAVEGSIATVNGNQILTQDAGDSYIINLIGGSADTANTPNTVVKRDGNGDFAAGIISANRVNIGTAGWIEDDSDIEVHSTSGNDIRLYANNGSGDVRLYAGDDIVLTAANRIRLESPIIYAGENLNFVDGEIVVVRDYLAGELNNYTTTANLDTEVDNLGYLKSADITNTLSNSAGLGLDWNSETETFEINASGAVGDSSISGLTVYPGTGPNAVSFVSIDRNTVDTWYDAEGSATTAENNAKLYADGLINDASTTTTNNWSAYKTSTEIGLAQSAAETFATNAVSALVDSAPEMLNTLNELAAAIGDDENYATTVSGLISGKQNNLTAGDNISIISDTISVTGLDTDDVSEGSNQYFTTQRARDSINSNPGSGISYDSSTGSISVTTGTYDSYGSASLAQSAAEQTALGYVADVLDATTPFQSININDVAKQVAARISATAGATVTAYEFNKTNFKSGKFLVKIDNGTHNEVSEVLVTLDSSDNIAITEYAIVGTNGSRGTITADTFNSHARIRVTPVDGSTISVYGTIFNA